MIPIADSRLPHESQSGIKQNNECILDNATGGPCGKAQAQLTVRLVAELRPHSSYAQLGLRVPLSKLNALIEQGKCALYGREFVSIWNFRFNLELSIVPLTMLV